MPKVKQVTARKEYKCQKCGADIHKGDSYFIGTANFRKPIRRCKNCGLLPYELSSSEYVYRTGALLHDWRSITDTDIEVLIDELSELQTQAEDSLENMPELLRESSWSGELLQERYDTLDCIISDLQSVSTEEPEWTSAVDDILETYL